MDVRTPLASISLLCDYCSVTKNKNISIIISYSSSQNSSSFQYCNSFYGQ
uniref:Uncharacterized protein n=1 Tax=Anguilla anguilla TaxID=7936 RepID=A0A0E9RK30_ANGAN